MRERAPTLNLEDDDIVGIAVAPLNIGRSSAPPLRKTSAPPPPPASIPAPPRSHVVAKHVAPPASAPVSGLAFPRVPTFDAVPAVAPPAPVPEAPRVAAPSRLSVTDPTDLIFDGMYGLTFAKSMGEAAEMCAETLARALRARTVVIHTRDLTSGELRAIGAHGDGDFDIIGSSEAGEADLVASAVLGSQQSVTMTFDGELPQLAPRRLHAVGGLQSVVAAPAISWGRCVAIIEVIDADETFSARVADSATYVADHLAQFISAHAA